ncbi:MAG TPA: glycosyltransferase 87 family protein [Candidatus Polarisedimenticolia bacterium]
MIGSVASGNQESAPPREPSFGGRGEWLVPALLAALVLAIVTVRVSRQYRPLTYLVGDCPYYAATAASLIEDHDLDLRNQLQGGLEVHGPQIALGRNGAWYPKHPLLMPFAALPLVMAFGIPGTLLFNVLVVGALAVVLQRLARPVATPWAAGAASLLLIFGTFLRRYDYNFSPDLFATLVLTTAWLALQRGRDRQGGLLLGLAATAKLTHLFLLPFGLAYAAWCRRGRGLARAAGAAAAPLAALALLNAALFGSPFVTSYDRNVIFDHGRPIVVSHRGLFDGSPLQGLEGELFDPVHGLVPTSPMLLLALPGVLILLQRRPREAVLFIAVGEFLLLFFSTYRYWSLSHYGNRFLMPLVAVASPPVALTLDRMAAGARSWLAKRHAPAALQRPA